MIEAKLIGDWAKCKAFLDKLDDNFKKAYKTGLNRVGQAAVKSLKKGMTEGAPGGQKYAPNHPFTIARKGSSKPLINHGDLRNSITYRVIGGATVFAGVLRSAKGKDGQQLVNIAAIHELGDGNGGDLYIKVTPKMRAYLHSQGLHLKESTKYIRIPRRPTFEPVFEAEKENWQELFIKTVQQGTIGGGS
ncbi:phage virion morphogenesis protein [Thermoanaerobacterium sp. DL9XJH110]|uniref:phage virion morphogenesis protein n=1 Tax=Thermoanaerobacterium sp. DL9XJH110 TaxID=3386643 RepID=UPI003BB7205C